MAKKIENLSVEDFIEYNWLGLGDLSLISIDNPLSLTEDWEAENPHLRAFNIFRDPENFPFTCRHLLGIEIAPHQHVILKELWRRPFPMLVASRGYGKTFLLAVYTMLKMLLHQDSKVVVCGAAFRQSKLIFEYVEKIWRDARLLHDLVKNMKGQGIRKDVDRWSFRLGNSEGLAVPIGDGCLAHDTLITYHDRFGTISDDALDGNLIIKRTTKIWGNNSFRKSDEAYHNGVKKVKCILTDRGYHFMGTHNHKMKVCRGGEILWVRADKLVIGDRILIDRSFRWHKGKIDCTLDDAYTLGAMIGDGSWTNKYFLRFAGKGGELVKFLNRSSIIGKQFTQQDDVHYQMNGKNNVTRWLNYWGLPEGCRTPNKTLPDTILRASREQMSACLSGLFDTDGSVQSTTDKRGGHAVSISFWNTSERLIDQMQYILLHYGIIATKRSRKKKGSDKWLREFSLQISGPDCEKFAEHIGFRMRKKQASLLGGLDKKSRSVSIKDIIPGVLDEMIGIASKYENEYKGHYHVTSSKMQAERKNATRPLIDKFLSRYGKCNEKSIRRIEELSNPDIYYDVIVDIKDSDSDTYDIHVPNGHEYCANGFFSHNSKIRGLRANVVIADEFRSVPVKVYEEVIEGFGAVSQSPIYNMKILGRHEAMKQLGLNPKEDNIKNLIINNQSILSGTAGYIFESFGEYWKRYKGIVESGGDRERLMLAMGNEPGEGFDWRDYSVIRIPNDMLPKGHMAEKTVARSKATSSESSYHLEYGAIFVEDSEGFYKRTLIERCTAYDNKPVVLNGKSHTFGPLISGRGGKQYVYGIDPASESDNFSIVVLELNEDHRRVVYCWTTTRAKFKNKLDKGISYNEDSFYEYINRKIRELMLVFPTEHIALDMQGGGYGVLESLQSLKSLKRGELPILPFISYDTDPFFWEKKDKPTDVLGGLHYVHMCQFANAEFTSKANHGMRQDMENRVLLFPHYDSASLEIALAKDAEAKDEGAIRIYDTLEDCTVEIEELKDELCTIVHTHTTMGREKWDTPETQIVEGGKSKKGRQRKDRYSALVLANMIARTIGLAIKVPETDCYGGFVADLTDDSNKNKEQSTHMYNGNPMYNLDINMYSQGLVIRH